MTSSPSPSRSVAQVVRGQPTSDGAGVKLTRVIGQRALDMLDPFLLLDEFRSDQAGDYLAGFPNHPHRGFETVTYMLAGRMRHGDNQGNRGLLTPGSVQWMTAGRGIVHSEMPEQEDGLMWGFQLWVNLPAGDKMTAPRYQDIAPERIPEATPAPGATGDNHSGEAEEASHAEKAKAAAEATPKPDSQRQTPRPVTSAPDPIVPSTGETVTDSDKANHTGVKKGEGKTPGFWKNNADKWDAAAWPRDASGTLLYAPTATLESVFDVPDALGIDNATLLEALDFNGGGVHALTATLPRCPTSP